MGKIKNFKLVNGNNKTIEVYPNVFAEIFQAAKDFRNNFAILTDINGEYHTVDYDVNFPDRLF